LLQKRSVLFENFEGLTRTGCLQLEHGTNRNDVLLIPDLAALPHFLEQDLFLRWEGKNAPPQMQHVFVYDF